MRFRDLKRIELEPAQQEEISKRAFQDIPQYQASIQPMQFRNTFLQDVNDHIQTSWLGQLASYIDEDRSYQNEPIENFDPIEELPQKYRPYLKSFRGVRNRNHMKAIMNRIDRNLNIKARIDYADRLTPGFVAALADPITYVPIPFAKGIGFFKGFAKGGAIGGGLIGATEIPRQALDPTADLGESVANVSFATVVSGLFGGVYGRMTVNLGEKATRTVYKGKSPDSIPDQYNARMEEAEGGINPDNIEVTFNFKQDAPGVVIINKNKPSPTTGTNKAGVRHVGTFDQQTVERAVSDTGMKIAVDTAPNNFNVKPQQKVAQFNRKANTVDVNFVNAKGQFSTGKHLVYLNKLGIRVGPNFFKSSEDWIRYNIKKAIYEELPAFSRKPKETQLDHQRRINKAVIKDVSIESSIDATTDTNTFLEMIPNWTNASQVINNTTEKKVSNPALRKKLILKMIELTGDYATVNKTNDVYKTVPESVVTAVGTRHNAQITIALRNIEKNFLKLHGTDPNVGPIREVVARTSIATQAMADKVQNMFSRQARGVPQTLDFKEYSLMLGRYIIDPESIRNVVPNNIYLNIEESAKLFKKVTKFYDDQLAQQGMYANQQNYLQLIRKKEFAIKRIDELLTPETKKNVGAKDYQRLINIKQNLEAQTNNIKRIQEVFPSDRPYWKDEDYFHRIWKREAILENADQFKGILRNYISKQLPNNFSKAEYIKNRNTFAKTPEEKIPKGATIDEILDAEVEYHFNDIIENQARYADGEGIAGYGTDVNGKYRIGATPLLDRKLKIPNKDVIDFIETDAAYVLRSYSQRVAPAVELANKFGDVHLNDFITNTEIDLIINGTKATTRNSILNNFIDEKDKVLGTLYSSDPTSINMRVAQALRNWASLAYMGRVVLSAIPELARPIMTNGIGSVMKGNVTPYLNGMESFKKSNLKDLRWLAPTIEMTLNSFNRRFMYDGGITHSRKNTMGWFDKYVGQWLERPQNAFYMLNGLTPWTHMIKEFHGLVAMHRILEDSFKWANGTLSASSKRRLASFGIDEKTAITISKMPIERNGDQFLANATMWDSRKGGTIARRKLATAIYADTQRTIITPSVADRPNMMAGVIRINSEGIKELVDNPLMRGLGFTVDDYGAKFNNAYMALLFQFYSYGVSSVKRLGTNVIQNRDGASAAVSGVLGMVALGFLADSLKSGNYYKDKEFGEKVVRAVELSGITTLAGDMNFMMETISGGFFDEPMGVRPMLDLDGRFGTPDETDAWGEVTGAAPGMLFDIHKAFTDPDLSERERSGIFRRSIPGNSLWFWDETFRNTFNSIYGVD